MDGSLALHTDRYQLTMLAAHAENGLASRRSTFELFVRRLPTSRRFMVACGIGRVVDQLAALRFTSEHLAWLEGDRFLGPALRRPAVRALFENFRFRARVSAIPEGRICFPGEPLVRVEGTLAEAQLVETLLLSVVNHDVRIASKCVRIVEAAQGRDCFEFGSRRTHELAAVDAARAAFVAGFAGTSNEEAARRYGVPIAGTMAHSFVLAHAADSGEEGETTAFSDFYRTFESPSTCLVDTFDTARGVSHALEAVRLARSTDGAVARELGGVRIDSGDLGTLARETRKTLDDAGARRARIVLSSDLDEYRIEELLRAGTPVDAFGVGTMAVSPPDHPSLGAVYKLVAIDDAHGRSMAVQKRATEKGSSAGPKQVWRASGRLEDRIALVGEPARPDEEALLVTVFDGEKPVGDRGAPAARTRLVRDLESAPPALRAIADRAENEGYPVERSDALRAMQAVVAREGRARL